MRVDVPGLALYGGSIAPGHLHGKAQTVQDVFEAVGAFAARLREWGVQPGDRVALLSSTRYEWVILDYAILSIGAPKREVLRPW